MTTEKGKPAKETAEAFPRTDLSGIRFDERGLVPAIVQEAGTGQVLMMAYMNRESLGKTLETGLTWFYSRSREQLWNKGETSGNTQTVRQIRYDCDGDTLLLTVDQTGPACHTGEKSCFFNELVPAVGQETGGGGEDPILQKIAGIIEDRRRQPRQGSYTNYLFDSGLDKILKKIGEESAEVIIASKNQGKEELVGEISDLVYHTLVLINQRGVTLAEIEAELEKRHRT